METILRSAEMAEIMLVPVRHHSPACALQLRKVINQWQPSAILVEGPENANHLLPVMVHAETKAPFAIYYAYHDKTKVLSEEQEHFKCYYPFLEYSPELTAVREAAKRGIDAAFIDLSYGDILAASTVGKGLRKEEEKNTYNDDYLLSQNTYIEKLLEKTSLRSFDEFWEKFFEIKGLYEETDVWFSHLLTYCKLAREHTPPEILQEEGSLAREAHMAEHILQYAAAQSSEKGIKDFGELQKILVVTGGFHTPALAQHLCVKTGKKMVTTKTKQSSKVPAKNQSVYLMPYSMEAADALNGYASGMPFAGFYQRVWDYCQETQQPYLDNGAYQKAVLDLLVESGKEVRRKEGNLSTYDEICAWQMAQGLMELRSKPQPGAYELLDAALSSYVKGEYNIASDTPIRILRQLMTGEGMGTLCAQADVPPILQDFEAQCKTFRFKIQSTLESEVTLSIFSEKKHRTISSFLHRMVFLNTTFARRVKGPNLQLKRDRNLIREIWKYKWTTAVPTALIDVSVYGATIEEAVTSLVQKQLKKDISAGEAAKLLTQVFEMNLTGQLEAVYDCVNERILHDTDFYSVADALKYLIMMDELGTLYQTELRFEDLLRRCVQKLITLLPSIIGIKEENLTACMDALKLLYRITNRANMKLAAESELYYETLETMVYGHPMDNTALNGNVPPDKQTDLQIGIHADLHTDMRADLHAGLCGCIHGILYGSGREGAANVEFACRGYLTGTKEQLMQTAVFFRGLFYTARDLIFIGGQILELLDTFFGQVDSTEFMELLPQLRMAFAYFTPAETDKIARRAAKLHKSVQKNPQAASSPENSSSAWNKTGGEDILTRNIVLPEWYTYAKALDAYVQGQMEIEV